MTFFAAAGRRQADLTDEDFSPDMKRPNGEKNLRERIIL